MTDLVELQTELQTRLTEFGLKLVISHTDRHQTYKIKMKKWNTSESKKIIKKLFFSTFSDKTRNKRELAARRTGCHE